MQRGDARRAESKKVVRKAGGVGRKVWGRRYA